MVKTGHPGAGTCVGARRAAACAGMEAGGRRKGLWGCGGDAQSLTVPRACLCPWSLAERKAVCDGVSQGHVRRGRATG